MQLYHKLHQFSLRFSLHVFSRFSRHGFRPLPSHLLKESSERTHFVCIPSYGFSRPASPFLLSISSDFYKAYLARHDNQYTVSLCQHCQTEHTSQQFCLPATFTFLEVDLILDFLEQTPQTVFAPRSFFPLFAAAIIPFFRHMSFLNYANLSPSPYAHSIPLHSGFTRAFTQQQLRRLGLIFCRYLFFSITYLFFCSWSCTVTLIHRFKST